jgi:hypothetical protein
MNIPWSKPVILALAGPGTSTTISTAQEASWAMIEDWPLDEGPALDHALEICGELSKGKADREAVRRAFVAAAAEACLEVKR